MAITETVASISAAAVLDTEQTKLDGTPETVKSTLAGLSSRATSEQIMSIANALADCLEYEMLHVKMTKSVLISNAA